MIKIETASVPPAALAEREALFELNGVTYTIPTEVPGSLALKAMDLMRRHNDAYATSWCMEELIGSEGYQALINSPHVTKSNMLAIQLVIRDRVFGGMEEEGKG